MLGAAAIVTAIALLVAGRFVFGWFESEPRLPSFRAQACALPTEWLERIERGHFEGRSGDISILPRQPAYMASGAGGWSHSGPWPYLQEVPLVFYGPGLIEGGVEVDRPVTLADVAPTVAALLKGSFEADGTRLEEVASLGPRDLSRKPPALILTIVWDGGGWNALDQWPRAWPNLARLMAGGVSYTNATAGSSPSVTPSVHTTLGTGVYPATHGITGIPVRYPNGDVADSFARGESSAFIEVPTIAERWDAQRNNDPLVAMVGYEPWHLGMIGQGAERPGGDRDDAAWLDIETNEWITNPEHYDLPPQLGRAGGLGAGLEEVDAADGKVDGAWRDNPILDDRDRWEETPAFIGYHTRGMLRMIEARGYGRDSVTDLVYTNYKQIDRVGHYYSMHAPEVRDSLVETDVQLGNILEFLDERVGRGRYVVVLTADHGMQPDEDVTDGYGVNPTELEEDVAARFGPIIRGAWPTEVFLYPDELEKNGITVDEVARYIGDYRLDQNITDDPGAGGAFEADDRLFQLAVPSEMLNGDLSC